MGAHNMPNSKIFPIQNFSVVWYIDIHAISNRITTKIINYYFLTR